MPFSQDFSYGSSATFACLALTGRQLTRHHGKGHGLRESRGPDFDSVAGRLPGRNCSTWVFPQSATRPIFIDFKAFKCF